MSVAAAYGRFTERGARQFVPDEGLTIAPRKVSALDRLIAASRQWQERHAERVAAMAETQAFLIEKSRAAVANGDPTPRDVIRVIAADQGFTYEDMIAPTWNKRIADCRHECVAAVYLRFYGKGRGRNLAWVGKQFGGRDHTTVLNSLARRGIKHPTPSKKERAAKSSRRNLK